MPGDCLDSEFCLSLRVYIEDTDAGGIVYYVNYLKFMERARTELMRSLGFDKPALVGEQGLMVVHSAKIGYRRPAKLDDQLLVTTKICKLARTYIVFEQKIWRDSQLLCEAEIKVACVTAETMKPCALPQVMHRAIESWVSR